MRLNTRLINSGATFKRMMRRLLEDVKNVEHYIDDCLVHTESWEQHMKTLERIPREGQAS